MNSAKSGNVTLALQAEPVEDTLSDDLEPLLRRHVEPGREIVIVLAIEDLDGPDAPALVADAALRRHSPGHAVQRSGLA